MLESDVVLKWQSGFTFKKKGADFCPKMSRNDFFQGLPAVRTSASSARSCEVDEQTGRLKSSELEWREKGGKLIGAQRRENVESEGCAGSPSAPSSWLTPGSASLASFGEESLTQVGRGGSFTEHEGQIHRFPMTIPRTPRCRARSHGGVLGSSKTPSHIMGSELKANKPTW